ncbi:MAG: hypothetical protein ABI041_01215 [Bdellovibrionia bacterium]
MPEPVAPPPPEPVVPSGLTQVRGTAQFGSQCPLGFYAPPTKVPLELWTCPIGLDPVELLEPLAPLVLQVDCKKRIMDLRGTDRSSQASTWEIMPDGSFYFKVDGGIAKLKNDGSGHKNCTIPLFANLWGKVDCAARDKAVVQLETVWWLGPQPEETPQTSPSPLLSPLPYPTVSMTPSPSSSPSEIPTPLPSSSPSPSASPSVRHSFSVEPVFDSSVASPASGGGGASVPSGESTCHVPVGCFFHNKTQVNPCL